MLPLVHAQIAQHAPLHSLPMAFSVELAPGSESGRPDLLLLESFGSDDDSADGAAGLLGPASDEPSETVPMSPADCKMAIPVSMSSHHLQAIGFGFTHLVILQPVPLI